MTDWESEFKTLAHESIANLVACDGHRGEYAEKEQALQTLVVRDTVARAGWNPYQAGGARIAAHLIRLLDEGQIIPPVYIRTVWTLAARLRCYPDWPPTEPGDDV